MKNSKSPANFRPIIGVWIGTALENFDFAIYATGAALIFSKTFFPNISYELGVLSSLATYAVGFFARPLGGIIFSHIGDRLGRKTVLVSTLFLMGFSTFGIGLLPDYNSAGVISPILLVGLRILQGVGSGAEQAGGLVYLAEMAPAGKAGRWTSFVFVGTTTGTCLGALAWFSVRIFAGDFLTLGAWRLVFLSSILVTAAAFVLRFRLPESKVFLQEAVDEKRVDVKKSPIKEAVQNSFSKMVQVFCVNIGANAASYIVHTYFVTYLALVGFNAVDIPQMILISGVISIPSAYLGGMLTDAVGAKNAQRILQTATCIYCFFAFWIFSSGNSFFATAALAAGYALVAALNSPQGVFFSSLFPARHRYAGVTLPREFSAALGGGLAPLIAGFLVFQTGSTLGVSLYIAALLGVSFAATSFSK